MKKKIDNNQLFFKNHINIIDTSNVNIDVKIKLYENILPELNNNYEKLKLEKKIAETYFELEQYDKSIEKYELLLKKYNFKNSNNIASYEDIYIDLYIDIGYCYYNLFNYKKANEIFLKIKDNCIKYYNIEHKNTLNIENSIAYCHIHLKDYKIAETLIEKLIPKMNKIYGNNHCEPILLNKNLMKYKKKLII